MSIDRDASSESGKRSAVSATSSNEIPSTPTFQAMSHGWYHSTRSVNWKPASPVSNATSIQPAMATGTIDTRTPTGAAARAGAWGAA